MQIEQTQRDKGSNQLNWKRRRLRMCKGRTKQGGRRTLQIAQTQMENCERRMEEDCSWGSMQIQQVQRK